MKLLHIADLHLGKRVNGMSMIAEQLHVIGQLHDIAREEGVAGVLIAGDVFDRPIPSREALEACELLFSGFIDKGIPVFAIPGNHDSPQQLAFCSSLLSSSGLHIAKAFDGSVDHFDIEADSQHVRIHLLPFVRPTDVRMALPERAQDIKSHDDAVRVALEQVQLDPSAPNILVAHQFVTSGGTAPGTCDSEILSIGGSDNVDVAVFDAFDYVALGHLHGAQRIGRDSVRYSGSPLKYSFSEVNHKKGATIVEIADGEITHFARSIVPIHDMRELTASFAELESGIDEGNHLDYLRITLADKSLPDAMAKLRLIYPNILRLDWERHASTESSIAGARRVESTSPVELFEAFYELQTGEELTESERGLVEQCAEEALQ